MLFEKGRKISLFLLLVALSSACGLVTSSGDSMSNADRAVLYLQMGTRYLELDILDVAKEKLETARRLDSSNAEIYNALGSFYERIREYDEAADNFETAVSKDPNSYSIKSNYGRFLCERGQYKTGLAKLQEAIDLPMNNRQWFALTHIGMCYVKQNNLKQGEEYLRQALLLQPDYPPALEQMLIVSYKNRQYMSARAFLERYLSFAKHSPETLWYGFQNERALGNGKLAEEYGAQLLSTYPASKEAKDIKTVLGK